MPVVFDRCIDNSLKGRTREKRSIHAPVKYKVHDDISLKQDLTVYLRKFLMEAFSKEQTDSLCHFFWYNYTMFNISNMDPQLDGNSHEWDSLNFSCIRYSKTNPFLQLKVVSPETDVFLLLIYVSLTSVRTGFVTGEYVISPTIPSFAAGRGSNKRQLMTGWHMKLWEQIKVQHC